MEGETVSLTLSTRPLRVLFLVIDASEVLEAIRLYTHLWGGAANTILPLPTTEVDVIRFKRAALRFDPDIVFTFQDEILGPLAPVLTELPFQIKRVTREKISAYVEGRELFQILGGEAIHPAALLAKDFPTRQAETTNIRMFSGSTLPYELELAIQFGIPSDMYVQYLQNHLGGTVLKAPQEAQGLCKAVLLSAQRVTPASLSLRATRVHSSFNIMFAEEATPLESGRVDSEHTLFLFLTAGDVHTACASWNSRRLSTHTNKYVLPRDLFVHSLPLTLEMLRVGDYFTSVVVFASGTRDEALHIYQAIQGHLNISNDEIPVAVYYHGFAYELWQGGVYSGPSVSSTLPVGSDTSLSFVPALPPVHNRSSNIFGFDAGVQFNTGAKLSLPRTPLTTRLLLNSRDQLQRAREDEGGVGELWLRRSQDVRPNSAGLSGFSAPGKEVRVYLHPEDLLIHEVLLHRGFRVKPNKHTRYARGFIRRFGGVEKTLKLIRSGGGHILGALLQSRGEEGGVSPQRISRYVSERLNCDLPTANKLVRKHIPGLVAAGLVRRGVPLKCPHCDLNEWYSVDDLGEFVECAGCAESFQLSGDGIRFSYTANELARRFIQEGGHAVLMTASVLRRMDRSAAIEFGGELMRGDERANFAELDLFWLPGDQLVPVECKALEHVTPNHIGEIEVSLDNAVTIAKAIRSPIVLLGLLTTQHGSELFTQLGVFAERAAEEGMGVHMILNGQFHPWCRADSIDPTRIDVPKLIATEENPAVDYVGMLSKGYGVGSISGPVSPETMDGWEADLS